MPPRVLTHGNTPENWILSNRDLVELAEALALEKADATTGPTTETPPEGTLPDDNGDTDVRPARLTTLAERSPGLPGLV